MWLTTCDDMDDMCEGVRTELMSGIRGPEFEL